MPSDVGSWFQQGPGNASSSLGQVSDLPLTWTVIDSNAVSNVSEEIVPAAAGVGRTIVIVVPPGSDTGICINFGAAATTAKQLLPPGFYVFNTAQQIQAIRAGASDVTVYCSVGVV